MQEMDSFSLRSLSYPSFYLFILFSSAYFVLFALIVPIHLSQLKYIHPRLTQQ